MSTTSPHYADWRRELQRDVDHQKHLAMCWPSASNRKFVQEKLATLLRRRTYITDRDAAMLLLRLLPDSHEQDLDEMKKIKPVDICEKLHISIRGKISSGTSQGIVFSAIHLPSDAKLVVKLTPQKTKHAVASIAWSSSDDAMVEAKLMSFANEASIAMGIGIVPRYFGQFLVQYKDATCTMLIQEEVPIDMEDAIEACSSTPASLLSFVVETIGTIFALHSIGITHNDLHRHNIRARPRSERSIYRSERDGKEHESVCPFEIVAIDLGRSCIRDSVCSKVSIRHAFPTDRAHLDLVRFLTSMRTKIFTVAAKMLATRDKCSNWKDVCSLLCIMQFFSTAVGFVWDDHRATWHRPFRADGTHSGSYSAAFDICKRQGNTMPFASAHYIVSAKHGPPLVELLPPPSPPRKRAEAVKRLHYEKKGSLA
jgi:hypothetical protein